MTTLIEQQTQMETQIETQNKTKNVFEKITESDVRSIAVIGESGSGKTCWCWNLLKHYNKPVYILKHPNPELVEKLGYMNMYSIDAFARVKGAVLYIDEPQLILPYTDGRGNVPLGKLLSIARQNDNVLVISTSVTQYFTRMLEGQIDVWIVKDIEYQGCKQGSRIRKVIKDNSIISPEDFMLGKDEFLFYSRRFPALNRRHNFTKPSWFTDEMSKPYGVKE